MEIKQENETAELDKLVSRLEAHQAALRLSDNAYSKRYARWVGSQKTWVSRLKTRSFDGVNVAQWIKRLTSAVVELDGGSLGATEFFDDLPMAKLFAARWEILQGQDSDRRCMVCLGVTGVGKTTAARNMVNASGGNAVFVTIPHTWKDSTLQLANGILRALGAGEEARAGTAWSTLTARLSSRRTTLVLDDAHEGGVALFKMCKTLIDTTPTRIVLLAYPQSWDKLVRGSADAWAEAQQLLGRTVRPICDEYRTGTRREDVVSYFQKTTDMPLGLCKRAAGELLPLAKAHGNLRFVVDVVAATRLIADENGVPITPELIIEGAMILTGGKN